jgi:hypothetical protein
MWINSETGEIYTGDPRFGTADFAAPSDPPPGVAHAVLNEGAFVEWGAAPDPEPDWVGYLISMMSNALWQQWVDSLPLHHAIGTTGAAQRENAAMLQATFNAAALAIATPDGARAEWQAIADANNIAVDFEGI